MKMIEGYWNSTPKIKDIAFPIRGKMQVNLNDGRVIIVPLSAFPSIKKLPKQDRENWFIIGGGISFDKSTEVIHIEQILGNFINYAHENVN
ncbi:MAG: DUF2442 domain-containing protein [Paludibacter sp.]|nr:DUF2442 domain-containing protein [Paludibacter sp.]